MPEQTDDNEGPPELAGVPGCYCVACERARRSAQRTMTVLDEANEAEAESESESDDLVRCTCCARLGPLSQTRTVGGNVWCGSCVSLNAGTCARCDVLVSESDTHRVETHYRAAVWCTSCAETYAARCSHCDVHVAAIATYYSEVHDASCCRSCYYAVVESNDNGHDDDDDDDDDDDESSNIESYSHRPRPLFVSVQNGDIIHEYEAKDACYLGLELEVESMGSFSTSRIAREATKSGLPVYCKDDGSLTDGVEIVSHPITFDAWRALKTKVHALCETLRSGGVRSYNTTTCGLHVHVSRKALGGALHLYKLLAFVYHNPRFIQKLSQRRSIGAMDQYASLSEPIADLPRKALRAGTDDFRRYSAVNVQNWDTVEFRVFRGTLATDGVYRALEATHAIVEFTRDVSAEDATRVSLFRAFVDKERKRYPTLYAWLAAGKAEEAELINA